MKPFALLLFAALALPAAAQESATAEDRPAVAAERVRPALEAHMARLGLRWGAPVLIRIFKEESDLEVWLDDGERFRLFRNYAICDWSGTIGPKQRQGDFQAPEGFYGVRRGQLNPRSIAHLSFDLGYPNALDRAHGRDGAFLMVHGGCISIGCYAVQDDQIEQIYTLVAAAFDAGQDSVQVQAYPFRFELRQEAGWADHEWAPFWRDLRAGHDAFVRSGRPPRIDVVDGRYVATEVASDDL
jgi:murein L,D-transpeptidase YafK